MGHFGCLLFVGHFGCKNRLKLGGFCVSFLIFIVFLANIRPKTAGREDSRSARTAGVKMLDEEQKTTPSFTATPTLLPNR